jgi:hypothetical protein
VIAPSIGPRRRPCPPRSRQLVAGALKPRLHRDHLARRETLLVAPVLPQRHQLGRRAPPHHLVELLLAVAVTERDTARSRVVNVACCRVIASSAILGSAMIFSPFSRAMRVILDPLRLARSGRRDPPGRSCAAAPARSPAPPVR